MLVWYTLGVVVELSFSLASPYPSLDVCIAVCLHIHWDLCDLWPSREVRHWPEESAASVRKTLPEPSTQHLHPLPVPLPRQSQVGAQSSTCRLWPEWVALSGSCWHGNDCLLLLSSGHGQVEVHRLFPSRPGYRKRATAAHWYRLENTWVTRMYADTSLAAAFFPAIHVCLGNWRFHTIIPHDL